MTETSRPGDRSKVISVRFTVEEFEALSARATELGVGPSTLARTFVRQGLGTTASIASTASTTSPGFTGAAKPSGHVHSGPSVLEVRLAADLVARVEALERWVAEH
jgi:hypothetical protein